MDQGCSTYWNECMLHIFYTLVSCSKEAAGPWTCADLFWNTGKPVEPLHIRFGHDRRAAGSPQLSGHFHCLEDGKQENFCKSCSMIRIKLGKQHVSRHIKLGFLIPGALDSLSESNFKCRFVPFHPCKTKGWPTSSSPFT